MNIKRLGLVLSVILLAPALVLAGLRWQSSRASAADAAENLRRCRSLVEEIEALKTSPLQASLQMQSSQELASLLEQSAKAAQIPDSSVLRINPEAPRRVSKTSYVEQATRVELRQLTMGQIVAFLTEVANRDPRICPTALRLSAARTTGKLEVWQAEIVLTHLVFLPELAAF